MFYAQQRLCLGQRFHHLPSNVLQIRPRTMSQRRFHHILNCVQDNTTRLQLDRGRQFYSGGLP